MEWSAESAAEWAGCVRALTGNEAQDVVGTKVGVNGSTISRWRHGKRPGNPVEVRALALAYGANVLATFVKAGYLTPEEANTPPSARPDWARVTDDELLEQISARLKGSAGAVGGADGQRSRLSVAGGTPSPVIAAHEDVSIADEQESRGEP